MLVSLLLLLASPLLHAGVPTVSCWRPRCCMLTSLLWLLYLLGLAFFSFVRTHAISSSLLLLTNLLLLALPCCCYRCGFCCYSCLLVDDFAAMAGGHL
jgi:hypothetical protein